MEKSYNLLDFFLFKAFASDGTTYDVAVDFTDRSYIIQHVDSRGEVIGDDIIMPLRRSKVEQFRQDLQELGLLDWKVTAEFPHTFDGRICYSFLWDDENDFATEADGDLSKVKALHKLLEQLTNHTFGSYQVYEV